MTDWYVGQKIVCIDTQWEGPHKKLGTKLFRFYHVLTKGTTYTIRRINKHNHFPDRIIIILDEVVHPRRPDFFGFPPEIFRPLVDKQTDISIFTKMLYTNQLENVL